MYALKCAEINWKFSYIYIYKFNDLKKKGLFYWNQVNNKQWIVQC